MIEQRLLDALDDPDGSGPGDARLANGLEATLAGLTTHGTVPLANVIDVDSALSGAHVDDGGLVLLQSTRYAADSAAAGASPVTQSLSWGGDGPLAAEVTPSGRPYDYAVSVSVSSLNQLLTAQTQAGTFSFDSNVTTWPTSLGLTNYVVKIRPELPPTLVPDTASSAPTAHMASHGVRMTVVGKDDGRTKLQVVVDADMEVDFFHVVQFGDTRLNRTGDFADFEVSVIDNPQNLDEAAITAAVRNGDGAFGVPQFLSTNIALPTVAGLHQDVVETGRDGPNLVIYMLLS
jgi:hypothetical protein